MKRHLALAACLLTLTGCPAGKHLPPARIDPAATLGEGAKKDEVIEAEAKSIVAAPGDSALVSAAATRILDVLRLSPWAKTEATIKQLVAERDTAGKRADELAAQLDKANSRTDQIIRLGLAGFGALIIAGAVIIAVMAAQAGGVFVGVGPMQAGAIGAAGGSLLFASFAYGWALRHQNLVIGIFAACLVAAAALWVSNRRHASASSLNA